MRQIAAITRAAVDYLRQVQHADGSFMGMASTQLRDFSQATQRPTSFFTALIAGCLSPIPAVASIVKPAVSFLVEQRSPNWSWNYWPRDCATASSEPYPDDLDDTAYALAVISRNRPALIDGEAMGNIAAHLVACEVQPGGPYKTWITAVDSDAVWHDVDIAVNANIGYFLSLHDVSVPKLNDYIADCLRNDTLQSPYYVGSLPAIYFLARWYSGDGHDKLVTNTRQLLAERLALKKPCALELALLLSTACRLGLASSQLGLAASALIGLRQGDHWPAAAFYFEPPSDGQQRYAGSTSLTTAFALEALHLYRHYRPGTGVSGPSQRPSIPLAVRMATAEVSALRVNELTKPFRESMQLIRAMEHGGQHITNLAELTARSCGQPLSPVVAQELNLGSLYGWVAYTIYDDILDGSGSVSRLNIANWSLRRSMQHFSGARPTDDTFQALIRTTLDRIDGSNAWELTHARFKVDNGVLQTQRLPTYGRLKQLAGRSWGYQLAASGTFSALGYRIGSPEQLALEQFFEHFLIARQLHDDAHDWEDDLAAGHISAVVCMLLKQRSANTIESIDLATELPALRLLFWQEIIKRVTTSIYHHLQLARHALSHCQAIADPTQFSAWLDRLEAGTDQAIREWQEARAFISVYQGT